MTLSIHPSNLQERRHIFLERPHGFYAEPVLDERHRFDEHIVCADQDRLGPNEMRPSRERRSMILIVGIQNSQEGGCIDESAHVS